MSATVRSLPSRTRLLIGGVVVAMILALAPLASPPPAVAGPVAADDATYAACGRVFPDPLAYWLPGLGESTPYPGSGSPFAKGNATCRANSFISYADALSGLTYLTSRQDTGPFIELINLAETDDPRIREALDEEMGDGFTAGLPFVDGSRQQVPLQLIKVTAPEGASLVPDVQPTAEEDRAHFVFPLSIHGIERAGVEGGLRAIEDLVTYGATDPERLLLETYETSEITTQSGSMAENLRIGEVLMRSVSYFVLANPDGWRRGTDVSPADLPLDIPVSFQRYNGNGMDMNRDWPAVGYTEHQYTPWSEPETRSFGQTLQGLSDNWAGGIDLHGQLIDRAFSFTLIGGSQRPYDKNERVQQFVEEAYADAEIRLAWSSVIKSNDTPEACVPPGTSGSVSDDPNCDPTPRVYGVQYGTIWDTIDYTVSGAFGDWIDSPIGLGADGIDNEMSVSHLANCGTGTCYLTEFEQLHVDGNKSLIYGMLNFNLQPPPVAFDLGGHDVAYLANPRVLYNDAIRYPSAPAGATAPEAMTGTLQHAPQNTTTISEFDVANDDTTFIGGISTQITYQANLGGQSQGAVNRVHIERQVQDGETVEGLQAGDWQRLESYFNQSPVYVQAGARVDENHPRDGHYRVIMQGPASVSFTYTTSFSTEPVWPEVGQDAFEATNTQVFTDLKPFVANGNLVTVDPRKVLNGTRDLSDFDTVVVIDDAFLPGYVDEVGQAEEQPVRVAGSAHANFRDDDMSPNESGKNDLGSLGYTAQDLAQMTAAVDEFVRGGGNLVLTDDAIRAVEWLDYTSADSVRTREVYAGHVSFSVDGADTFDHPLAAGIDQPGAAEGTNSRRQTTEPVPIGYCVDSDTCGSDEETQPQWYVARSDWEDAGGVALGGDDTDAASDTRTSLGELPMGNGLVRILGSFAPFPTTEWDHQFGLSSYGVTDAGFTLMNNLIQHDNPGQNSSPDLSDDVIVPLPRSGSTPLDEVLPLPFDIVRYAGDDRIATAVDISRSRFSPREGLDVFVATAGNFPDALAGGPAAFTQAAPLLLTQVDTLPEATRLEIQRLNPERIFILGGPAAVSPEVQAELEDLAAVETIRLGGPNRFDTAATVAEEFFSPTNGTVYVATGANFPDTLAAGPAAATERAPILLVNPDSIPEVTRSLLERLDPASIVIVGGTATVSQDVEAELGDFADSVERVAGNDRIATSVEVSLRFFDTSSGAVYLATGNNFPDGLAGAPAAALEMAPIMLVGDSLPDGVLAEIQRLGVRRVVILGGTAAVSQQIEDDLRDRLTAG
ncbi:MAG: cell wall-binding repeat-containing protein [Euzebya sp.]